MTYIARDRIDPGAGIVLWLIAQCVNDVGLVRAGLDNRSGWALGRTAAEPVTGMRHAYVDVRSGRLGVAMRTAASVRR